MEGEGEGERAVRVSGEVQLSGKEKVMSANRMGSRLLVGKKLTSLRGELVTEVMDRDEAVSCFRPLVLIFTEDGVSREVVNSIYVSYLLIREPLRRVQP